MKKFVRLFFMTLLLLSVGQLFAQKHEYVDLGLPSGTLWATCNVGADTPEGYGDYFAWGETTPKTTYNWSTYKYCNDGEANMLTKYCCDSKRGYNGFTDNLTTLQPNDDAATANWGSDWCMPTKAQWIELYQNTTNTMMTQNGVKGWLFTASNGNSLFLPTAGSLRDDELRKDGIDGHYWSSSLDRVPISACYYFFNNVQRWVGEYFRCIGRSVRPVRSSPQN